MMLKISHTYVFSAKTFRWLTEPTRIMAFLGIISPYKSCKIRVKTVTEVQKIMHLDILDTVTVINSSSAFLFPLKNGCKSIPLMPSRYSRTLRTLPFKSYVPYILFMVEYIMMIHAKGGFLLHEYVIHQVIWFTIEAPALKGVPLE